MRRARAIITVSEHTRKDLLKYCPFIPPEKVFAIHNGLERKWSRIEDETRLKEVRRAYGLEGKTIVLHVGNDNWYKNVATLLHAFAAAADWLCVATGFTSGPGSTSSDVGLAVATPNGVMIPVVTGAAQLTPRATRQCNRDLVSGSARRTH